MQLYPNQKIFSEFFFFFFFVFPESKSNLQYFETKDEPQNLLVSEIIDSKKRGYFYRQSTC